MNNSINCAGFMDMLRNSNEDFEPYGCSEALETVEIASLRAQHIQPAFVSMLGDYDYES